MNKIKFFLLKYRNLLLWFFGDPAVFNIDDEQIEKEYFPKWYQEHLAKKNKDKKDCE